jgi:hypothetical protein
MAAAGGWGRTAEEQRTIADGHHRQSAPSRHPWAMVAVLGAICRSDSREHSGRSPGRSTPATLLHQPTVCCSPFACLHRGIRRMMLNSGRWVG